MRQRCGTSEQLRDLLRQERLPVVAYHGRMRASDRSSAQEALMNGGARLIVATNAFGMGIDRPDIRAVIHYDLPASLDVYYQESGRAGRDGLDAECVLLFQRRDRGLQSFFMAGRYPSHSDFQALIDGLQHAALAGAVTLEQIGTAMPAIAKAKIRVMLAVLRQDDERRQRDQFKLEQVIIYAQTALCRTAMLLEDLGEPRSDECGTCDHCRGTATRAEVVAQGAA